MITTIVIFLILLSVLVLTHEWGHYFSARRMKMGVEEFGLGFPPRLFSWKNKKTGVIWSFNLIPIGGFVKIEGENFEGDTGGDGSFCKRPIWQRFIVLFAGVFMNMVTAVVLFTIAIGIGSTAIVEDYEGSAIVEDRSLQVTQLMTDSPAEIAGLQMGDKIVSLDGQVFDVGQEVRDYLSEVEQGMSVIVGVDRGGEMLEVEATSEFIPELDHAGFGVAIYEAGVVYYPWYTLPWRGIETTAWYTQQICLGFYNMAASVFNGDGLGVEVSGPVGIAMMTGQAAQLGLAYILQFGAILSINLAILNILPIPALDGGRILFLAVEAVMGKPVNEKIEAVVHNIGFLLLILLILFITYKDVLGLMG